MSRTMTTRRRVVAGAAALALVLAACGDDETDEATTDTTAAAEDGGEGTTEGAAEVEIAPEDADFCAIATELDQQDEFPTVEQLETYRDSAPPEISEEANLIADAFIAAGDDPFAAFEAPGVDEAFSDVLEPYETEHCGLHQDSEDEEDQDPSLTEPDESATQVAVTAREYAFEFDAPAAGRTQFTMTNEGEERHVMYLFKLSEGRSVDDVLESEGDDGVEFDAESDTAAPGEQAILTVDLTPGDWAMICYIPTPEGAPHFTEGMRNEFTVE